MLIATAAILLLLNPQEAIGATNIDVDPTWITRPPEPDESGYQQYQEALKQEPDALKSPRTDDTPKEPSLPTPKPKAPAKAISDAMVKDQPLPSHPPKGEMAVVSVSAANKAYCSCVNFARKETGIFTGRIGLAKNHPINTKAPEVGAIVVTTEGRYTGHLGVVEAIAADHILIADANYRSCRKTVRWMPIKSAMIRGYYVAKEV